MAEVSFQDFYKVPELKFDISRLKEDLDKVLERKKFKSPGVTHFGAISLNRVPNDESSVEGNNVRGKYWTIADEMGKEVSRDIDIDESKYTELVPDFEDSVWEASATNKAVSLIKMEYDLQKPYRLKYEHLCEVEGLKLVGLYKVPFQPMGNRLNDFCKLVWNENGMEFDCDKSYSIIYGTLKEINEKKK